MGIKWADCKVPLGYRLNDIKSIIKTKLAIHTTVTFSDVNETKACH